MSSTERLVAHSDIATSLALLSDHELAELVEAGHPVGDQVGGRSALIEVDGRKVFVKRMPLTDVERRPENIRSTANVFGLPAYCHYGIGRRPPASGLAGAGRPRDDDQLGAPAASRAFRCCITGGCCPTRGQPLPEELADVERSWPTGAADGSTSRPCARRQRA